MLSLHAEPSIWLKRGRRSKVVEWWREGLRSEVEAVRDSPLSFAMRQLLSNTNASPRANRSITASPPQYDASIHSVDPTKVQNELGALP
jgi:hypothetical protein